MQICLLFGTLINDFLVMVRWPVGGAPSDGDQTSASPPPAICLRLSQRFGQMPRLVVEPGGVKVLRRKPEHVGGGAIRRAEKNLDTL